jgi:hypothetical protein
MPQPFEQPRFCGFVDVLGYKAIVRDAPFTDAQRFHYLHSIFSSLAVSAYDIAHDFAGAITVRAVQFSDCFYFSSESAVTLVAALANFFANVFTFYDHTFNEPAPAGGFPDWLPFLRGGIVHDWMLEGLNITLPELHDPADRFCNPIGPAVANAYLLSEATDLEGMRLATTQFVRDRFVEEMPDIPPYPQGQLGLVAAKLTPIFMKQHKDYGDIYEVPWFESRLMTDNTLGTFNTLIAAERQFVPKVMKHYRGTWDAILRTPSLAHNDVLRNRAAEIRQDVVSRMAYTHWVRRGRPDGSPWNDWFVAEGIVRPPRCCGA